MNTIKTADVDRVRRRLEQAIKDAEEVGVTIRIDTVRHPLDIGNPRHAIDLWPARRGPAPQAPNDSGIPDMTPTLGVLAAVSELREHAVYVREDKERRDIIAASLEVVADDLERNSLWPMQSTKPTPDAQDAARNLRLAKDLGAVISNHVIAMQAAVIESELGDPAAGIQWIANTLAGPGFYPDIEAAKSMGGAQAWFDAKSEEEEKRVAAADKGGAL